MSSTRKITLKSSDGEAFEVDEAVALELQTIKHMIEDDCADSSIPLTKVTSKILAKVIEYCKKHLEAAASDDDLKAYIHVGRTTLLERTENRSIERHLEAMASGLRAWDAEFVKVDLDTLFNLVVAANFLNIKSQLDLTCQTVIDMAKGKTPEEIGNTFNIRNDFIPEDEEEDSRDNYWVIEI